MLKVEDYREKIEDLVIFLFDKNAIKIGNFTLSSGKASNLYIDLRILQSHPYFFRQAISLLKNYIFKSIGINSFDYICSIPTSGTIFGSALSYELFKPHIYIRKSPKSYGTKNMVEGDIKNNSKILMIDDVITSGKSLLSSINELKEKSVIDNILVLIDREEGSTTTLKPFVKNIHKIMSKNIIFEILYKKEKINRTILNKLIDES